MLYELLYEARTAARRKGLVTSGRKVFVRFSKKYFIIRDGKKRIYNHPMPLYLQVFFPQKNGKESRSYGLGYLIAVLYSLKGPYDFQYTPTNLELTGSRFFIKLNSMEYRIKHQIKIVWERMEKGEKQLTIQATIQWLNKEKPQLRMELEKLKKELREL